MKPNKTSILCRGCGTIFSVPRSRQRQQYCSAECRTDLNRKITFEPNSGCWLWLAAVNAKGYGILGNGLAHAALFKLHRGPIPDGLQLDHKCRMKCCVNPWHLEPVTGIENVKRARIARERERARCANGHLWTPENTYTNPSGYRVCRTCVRDSAARSRRESQ